jgi:ElaA protein
VKVKQTLEANPLEVYAVESAETARGLFLNHLLPTISPAVVFWGDARTSQAAGGLHVLKVHEEIAASANALRHYFKTPCAKTAKCIDCNNLQRICYTWSITAKTYPKRPGQDRAYQSGRGAVKNRSRVAMHINWAWKRFEELTVFELHEILAARQAVFVVEQACPYQDADALDKDAWHLIGRDYNYHMVAYARITFPGTRSAEPSIGRVLTIKTARGMGLARLTMQEAIAKARQKYPGHNILISAQTYLQNFYRSMGFETTGESYDEDGIEHVDMMLFVARPTPQSSS